MKFCKLTLSIALFLSSTIHAGTPVGYYTDGSLKNASELPEEGGCGWKHLFENYFGYEELAQDLKRIWGTKPLTDMITQTAADIYRRYPDCDNLQVEDLSARHGGDISRHASHENGLDVDLGFYKKNCQEHKPTTEQMYAPKMVLSDGSISPNFDLERNWELMKTLHKYGDVSRIFIDQKLKNALCSYAKSKSDYTDNIEVLRSLRHVNNHKDHIHVRIKCPSSANECRDQAPPPSGSGCP